MAEAKSNEFKNALEKEVIAIDKIYLRAKQKTMYECSANCCRSTNASAQQVASCIDNCSAEFEVFRSYVKSELNGFQERVQRCLSVCSDEAKDSLGINPNESQVKIANKQFETCAVKCIDKHIELIPSFIRRVCQALDNLQS